MTALRFAAALLPLSLLLVATQAQATSCSQWNRMNDDQKFNTIYAMIDRAKSSNRARDYGMTVSTSRVARCLDQNAENMLYDFDDVCGNSRTANMNAIDTRFKNYIWSCVR